MKRRVGTNGRNKEENGREVPGYNSNFPPSARSVLPFASCFLFSASAGFLPNRRAIAESVAKSFTFANPVAIANSRYRLTSMGRRHTVSRFAL
jgi:hypothetical protein